MTNITKIVQNPDVIIVEAVIVSDNVSVNLTTTAATNAGNSATAASASAADALASQQAAAASQQAAAAFGDLYLGAHLSDPTLDNEGDALVAGTLYFNSTTSTIRAYDGLAWLITSGTPESFIGTFEFTADLGQTVFPVVHTIGNIVVTLNGIRLSSVDFTSDGTAVTLLGGAALSDEIVVTTFTTFLVADTYTKAESDSRLDAATQLNDRNIFIGNSSNQKSTANFDSMVDERAIAYAIALG